MDLKFSPFLLFQIRIDIRGFTHFALQFLHIVPPYLQLEMSAGLSPVSRGRTSKSFPTWLME
jgi:hypothetical protein